jgi:putative addiction module killer protein
VALLAALAPLPRPPPIAYRPGASISTSPYSAAFSCDVVVYRLQEIVLVVRQTERFAEWLDALPDSKAKAVVVRRIERLAAGNPGDVKPVGAGVSELRIDYGPGFRVYFIRRRAVLIVLLCGGDKSTQAKDIARAKRLARDWTDKDDENHPL